MMLFVVVDKKYFVMIWSLFLSVHVNVCRILVFWVMQKIKSI